MPNFSAGITEAYVVNNSQSALDQLRRSLEIVADLYAWAEENGAAGLEAAPISMDSADATALMSALADANALAQIFLTGQAPGSYPQVTGTPYIYANSIRAIIGPLS